MRPASVPGWIRSGPPVGVVPSPLVVPSPPVLLLELLLELVDEVESDDPWVLSSLPP